MITRLTQFRSAIIIASLQCSLARNGGQKLFRRQKNEPHRRPQRIRARRNSKSSEPNCPNWKKKKPIAGMKMNYPRTDSLDRCQCRAGGNIEFGKQKKSADRFNRLKACRLAPRRPSLLAK